MAVKLGKKRRKQRRKWLKKQYDNAVEGVRVASEQYRDALSELSRAAMLKRMDEERKHG